MTNHKKIRPNYEAWYAHVEAWRINVEPLETRLSDFLNHTVGYAQLGLRSAFLLNGGGLIAAPTFAELLGSIWSRGQLPALTMFGAFVAGLILAGGSTLFAFFEFRAGQGILVKEIHRTKTYLDRIYNKKGLSLSFRQGNMLMTLGRRRGKNIQ